MAYFKDEEARGIIRETYAQVRSSSTAVAAAFYGEEELAALPAPAAMMALGVGHPVKRAELGAGEVVLDLGCGAGIDTLLAARAVGPTGRAIGLDMTSEMVERARTNARGAGLDNVEILQGLIEEIPLQFAVVEELTGHRGWLRSWAGWFRIGSCSCSSLAPASGYPVLGLYRIRTVSSPTETEHDYE